MDQITKPEVNPNAVWDKSRCDELQMLERLVYETSMINNGGRCLERIAECISMAQSLSYTELNSPMRVSFLQFLSNLAIKDRFWRPTMTTHWRSNLTDWYDISESERDERCDDPCLPEPWELEDDGDDETDD